MNIESTNHGMRLGEFKQGKKILDKGYIKYIDHMGSDQSFVEAARMSTGKGFFGWVWEDDMYADCVCSSCFTQQLYHTLPESDDEEDENWKGTKLCTNCWSSGIVMLVPEIGDYTGVSVDPTDLEKVKHVKPALLGRKGAPRDLGLLTTLYSNRHQTPFEMGEICIEVKAPLLVFREWHRHRTQSYNEFSARYSQMPNQHYLPETSRIQKQSRANKQGSAEALDHATASQIVSELERQQQDIYSTYGAWVGNGVAKEIARANTPVSRYSKMRAKTDVRNWLAFLILRMDMAAQWEIRQYANALASLMKLLFPKTFELFLEYDLLGVRFSRSEMRVVRAFFAKINDMSPQDFSEAFAHGGAVLVNLLNEVFTAQGIPNKNVNAFLTKIVQDKEVIYKDSI